MSLAQELSYVYAGFAFGVNSAVVTAALKLWACLSQISKEARRMAQQQDVQPSTELRQAATTGHS